MKTIVTKIHPFDKVQKYYVYSEQSMIDEGTFCLENAAKQLYDAAVIKSAEEIHLQGNPFFTIKLKEELTDKTNTNFSRHKINIIIEE